VIIDGSNFFVQTHIVMVVTKNWGFRSQNLYCMDSARLLRAALLLLTV